MELRMYRNVIGQNGGYPYTHTKHNINRTICFTYDESAPYIGHIQKYNSYIFMRLVTLLISAILTFFFKFPREYLSEICFHERFSHYIIFYFLSEKSHQCL